MLQYNNKPLYMLFEIQLVNQENNLIQNTDVALDQTGERESPSRPTTWTTPASPTALPSTGVTSCRTGTSAPAGNPCPSSAASTWPSFTTASLQLILGRGYNRNRYKIPADEESFCTRDERCNDVLEWRKLLLIKMFSHIKRNQEMKLELCLMLKKGFSDIFYISLTDLFPNFIYNLPIHHFLDHFWWTMYRVQVHSILLFFSNILKYSGLLPFSLFPLWVSAPGRYNTSTAAELAEFRKITKF